jgi:hypothetical protein
MKTPFSLMSHEFRIPRRIVLLLLVLEKNFQLRIVNPNNYKVDINKVKTKNHAILFIESNQLLRSHILEIGKFIMELTFSEKVGEMNRRRNIKINEMLDNGVLDFIKSQDDNGLLIHGLVPFFRHYIKGYWIFSPTIFCPFAPA